MIFEISGHDKFSFLYIRERFSRQAVRSLAQQYCHAYFDIINVIRAFTRINENTFEMYTM